MADPIQPPPTVNPQEAGLAFRAEMTALHLVYGYWKHAAVVLVLVLAGFFVYGQVMSWRAGQQRVVADQVSELDAALVDDLAQQLDPSVRDLLDKDDNSLLRVEQDLGQMDPQQQMQLVMGNPKVGKVLMGINQMPREAQSAVVQGTDQLGTVLMFLGDLDDASKARLEKGGDDLVGVATGKSGIEAARAALEAAGLYQKAGKPDKQRAALELAAKDDSSDPVTFAAQSTLANLDDAEGKPDDGIRRRQDLQKHMDGFYAQEADLQLALALEAGQKPAEASAIYDDFLKRWPTSPRAEEVKARQSKLPTAKQDTPTTPPAAPPASPGAPGSTDPTSTDPSKAG